MLLFLVTTAVALFAGGAVAMVRATRQPPGVQRLLAAPTRRIADADDQADVRIEGVVEVLDGTVPAPVSGIACVYVEVELVEVDSAGGPIVIGVVIERHVAGVPFIVRDSSGYAIVDPHGATALLDSHHDRRGRRGRMARREKRIAPGDTITVIGRGVREPDPDPTRVGGLYREGPPSRLRLGTSAQFPLHLLDRPPGGRR